ncbi:MAG: Poly-beta-1,6-N-acetyl-D-glucosamine synthase [Lentisphaerae bacterium ADurb.Bin242]|nr:MAG: Poly-beta-1,6-N-acetyl-D-glucosamine synthase [Lentisphaerae bacterium ADurb.Bin242]
MLLEKTGKKFYLGSIALWSVLIAVFLSAPYVYSLVRSNLAVYGSSTSWFLILPGIVFTVMGLFYLLFSAILAYIYKPCPKQKPEDRPGCTVIVPAYNEGRHVAETLYSLLECDYPADKLEIIAINDGSKDDTWSWILEAARHSNGRIAPINLAKNGGKKHALYCGILAAKHEIIVTVDSDSIVEKDAIANLVAPFQDPEVGGVAGNIRIKNLREGALPVMMDIGFMFGFEIIRSAHSIIGSVMCTPGALSGYRRSTILPHLDEWLEQKFLGVPATIGEDRAISSIILRNGHKVLFQSNAIAYTCVPSDYPKFCKMLLRWTRSDIRENWVMFKYAFGSFELPDFCRIGLQINLMAQILNIMMPLFYFPSMIYFLVFYPQCFGGILYINIVMGLICGAIPALIYARRYSLTDSIWAFVFSIYNLFALSWINVYSIFTVRNSNWLTRELPGRKSRVILPTPTA